MKKGLLIVVMAMVIFCLSGCGKTTYDEISYSELNNMLEAKDDFVLFIGSETCSACASYKITLNKIIEKYHTDIKYLDISKLSDKESSELQSRFPFTGTPTTVFITDGVEKNTYNRISGNEKYSSVLKKLIKNGYIEEEK